MPRQFATLDVFTDEKFCGNPLAVVHDGSGLSDAQMQQIAREFNLSETTFVLPAKDSANTANVRIFTPAAELPFAGHPTIGTAIALATEQGGDASLVLEEKVGLVPVEVELSSAGGRAEFSSPLLSEAAGEAPDNDHISRALGLILDEIGFDEQVPGVYSAGFPILFVPVRDADALDRAYPNMADWAALMAGSGARGAYVYTRGNTADEVKSRYFAPGDGIMEDPATGGAAATLPGQLIAGENYSDGTHKVAVLQGVKMGRPSHIDLSFDIDGGALKSVRIGGSAVFIQRGELLE